MTEERLEELWAILTKVIDYNRLNYDAAIAIGSVFGEMKSEIKKLQGHVLLPDVASVTNRKEENSMNFGQAIKALKEGKKVSREGWNGKGMFLYYVPASAYPPATEIAKEAFGGGLVPYRDYIAMKTAQNDIVPWVASQSDVLSEDWVIVE